MNRFLICIVLMILSGVNGVIFAAPNHPVSQSADVNQQIQGLLTSAQNYQQQIQTRLAQLNQQNTNLQQQLVTLKQQLATVSQQVNLQQTTKIIPPANSPIHFLSLQNPLINSHLAIGLMALGFLLLIWLLWYRMPTVKMTAAQSIEDEYDFMGSEEALPAKLALARAYIEMGNEESARAALAEVVNKGNKAQRDEALQLLKELPVQ